MNKHDAKVSSNLENVKYCKLCHDEMRADTKHLICIGCRRDIKEKAISVALVAGSCAASIFAAIKLESPASNEKEQGQEEA